MDEQTLLDFVSADLGADKLPRQIVFTDRLPYGLTGKIDRRALAQAPAPGEPNGTALDLSCRRRSYAGARR